VGLACCKVGLDRPLIPPAFVANLFRSAKVSRPRRSAGRRSPGDAPTVGEPSFGNAVRAGSSVHASGPLQGIERRGQTQLVA